jgi:hypothetical protein
MVSSKRLAEARKARRELAAASAAAGCTKAVYADHASARSPCCASREEAGERTVEVYPCDTCTGWHLTSKRSGPKVPPWDRNPDWQHPSANPKDVTSAKGL